MTTSDALIITCPSCNARNRVPRGKIDQGPRCGSCKASLPVGEVRIITDQNFAREVLDSSLPVLMDCWAPWCGPCRMVGPVVDQIAREYAGRLLVGKLNVDENPGTAQAFGIQSIPTLLIFQGGQVVDRVVGALPKGQVVERLGRVLR